MKFLKWAGIILGVLVILGFAGFQLMKSQTKKASPENTVEYVQGDLNIEVFYNRPSKKGRVIFGELLPYGEVWRTGANEATTFETNQDLTIGGNRLPAGKYTLWTIPGPDEWTIIFNEKQYGWGVSFGGKASREPDADVLQVNVPVEQLDELVEMFTIDIQDSASPTLTMMWDRTKVSLPMQP